MPETKSRAFYFFVAVHGVERTFIARRSVNLGTTYVCVWAAEPNHMTARRFSDTRTAYSSTMLQQLY